MNDLNTNTADERMTSEGKVDVVDSSAAPPESRTSQGGGHTPGPWTAYDDPGADWPGIDGAGCAIVLYGADGDDAGVRGHTREEATANARLIAAAPALADALRSALEEMERSRRVWPSATEHYPSALRKARAALSLVEGTDTQDAPGQDA